MRRPAHARLLLRRLSHRLTPRTTVSLHPLPLAHARVARGRHGRASPPFQAPSESRAGPCRPSLMLRTRNAIHRRQTLASIRQTLGSIRSLRPSSLRHQRANLSARGLARGPSASRPAQARAGPRRPGPLTHMWDRAGAAATHGGRGGRGGAGEQGPRLRLPPPRRTALPPLSGQLHAPAPLCRRLLARPRLRRLPRPALRQPRRRPRLAPRLPQSVSRAHAPPRPRPPSRPPMRLAHVRWVGVRWSNLVFFYAVGRVVAPSDSCKPRPAGRLEVWAG